MRRTREGLFFIGLGGEGGWSEISMIWWVVIVRIGMGGTDMHLGVTQMSRNVVVLIRVGCSSDGLFVMFESTRSGACPLVGDRYLVEIPRRMGF